MINLWKKLMVDGTISESHPVIDFAISDATTSNSISKVLSDYEALMQSWLAEVN
jgi:hypothetical protein